jgi:hypothetical protein
MIPLDSFPCASMAATTVPRAVSPSPCLTIWVRLWSVSAENALSQNANASASALTNTALPIFFSLDWAGLGFATPLTIAQFWNWLSAWWPTHWPKVRSSDEVPGLNPKSASGIFSAICVSSVFIAA